MVLTESPRGGDHQMDELFQRGDRGVANGPSSTKNGPIVFKWALLIHFKSSIVLSLSSFSLWSNVAKWGLTQKAKRKRKEG